MVGVEPPSRSGSRPRDHSVTGRPGQRTISKAVTTPVGTGAPCGCVLSDQPEFPSSIRQIPKTWQKRYSRSRVPPAARNSPCAAPTRSAPSSHAQSAAAWSRSNHRTTGNRPNPAWPRPSRRMPIRFRRRTTRRFRRATICRLAVRLFANRRQPIWHPLGPADRKRMPGPLPAVLERLARPTGGPIGLSHLHRAMNRLHRRHRRLLRQRNHLSHRRLHRLTHHLRRNRVGKGDGLGRRQYRPGLAVRLTGLVHR
jgi:hypothetical protein